MTLTPKQRLEDEQASIMAMADTTEAALALAALRWKSAAAKGEKGAADELLRAARALQEYRESKAPALAGGPIGEWFKNEAEAHNYLMSLGYEVSRGKFNQDKQAGKLTVDGKRISKFSVLQYGMALKKDRQFVGSVNTQELSARKELADTQKAEADARKAEIQAKELERELDEKWILREDSNNRLAAIVGQLGNLLHRHLLQAIPTLIHLCGGDPARGAELYEGTEEVIVRSFNELFSSGRIDGLFTEVEDDAA